MLEKERIEQFLRLIRNARPEALKVRLNHLFNYLEAEAAQNREYQRYDSTVQTWNSWPPLVSTHNMGPPELPQEYDQCKTLSFALYVTIAKLDKQSHVIPHHLFKRGRIEETIEAFQEAFFPYLEAALEDILNANQEAEETTMNSENPATVFVVHGRNGQIQTGMFEFLRAIGLRPLEWSQAVSSTGQGSPYVGDILHRAFQMAQAVVVLLTPDDIAHLDPTYLASGDPDYERNPTPQARPNVLFEAGMAFGNKPERTILVQFGDLRPFSDTVGRHIIRMDNSSQKRQDLADRLQAAGCPVDLSGRDWHTTGSLLL